MVWGCVGVRFGVGFMGMVRVRVRVDHDRDLEFRESYGHDPHTYKKIKVKGQSVRKIRLETTGRTDGRTDGGDCITSHANVVGNNHFICCMFV